MRMSVFFRHLFLFPLAVITMIPLWVMFVTSFSNKPLFLEDMSLWLPLQNITFDNYSSVWTLGNFNRYFVNSLLVSFCITVSNVIFDSMVAYAFARRNFFGKRVLLLLIAAKLMVPAAVLMVPMFLLVKTLNLYDTYGAMIFPMMTEAFGIYILIQAIRNIPQDYEAAARLEGFGDIRIFFSIVFPLLTPALVVVAIHSLLTSWNMYIYPLILTSRDAIRTLPLGVSFFLSSHPDASVAQFMATAVITAFPVILFFLFMQKKMISSLSQGALKE